MAQYFTKIVPYIVASATNDYENPAFEPVLESYELPIDETLTTTQFVRQTLSVDNDSAIPIAAADQLNVNTLLVQNLCPASENIRLVVSWTDDNAASAPEVEVYPGGMVLVNGFVGNLEIQARSTPTEAFQVTIVLLGSLP